MGFPGKYDKTDNGRQLSSKLWRNFNPMALAGNPAEGWMVVNDFHSYSATDVTLTQGGSEGTATISSTLGNGVLELTHAAGVPAGGDGPTLAWKGLGALPVAGATIAFEARIQVDSVADDYWVGMGGGSATAPIDTQPTDYAAFYVNDAGADWTFGQQDGTQDTEVDIVTPVVSTYIKLGFLIIGQESTEVYVNGELQNTSLTTASIPDGLIWPILAAESNSTGTPSLFADWMSVGYLAP